MQFGCIGEHLTHSFSKEIHALLQDYQYELLEIPMGELDTFMTRRDFQAINVTIPYKQAVIPYLDRIDDTAAAIGAVNTIVNRNGRLYGYNTDFGGMADLIRRTGIDLSGKKVLILGTGGTSNTALAVARHLGAACVHKVSRSAKPQTLTYEQALQAHTDAQVLINTTPRGMFSRESGMPIDPAQFPRLCGVIDAVYNPLRTEFVQKARSLGIPAVGGLYMLVRQAVLASEIFLDTSYPAGLTEEVYRAVKAAKENLVLIGMPGSGKTTVGTQLAEAMGRPFLDTDALIGETYGKAPAQIITEQGEQAFRDMESQIIRDVSAHTGCVIATGGGAVLRWENIDLLRRNGRIIFLDRPVSQLLPTEDRPLSSSKEAILQRYNERYPLYCAAADKTVAGSTPEDTVKELLK
jgi:shikimate dehydrogenase